MSHLAFDCRGKYFRFYQPSRKFINRHKIIPRRSKTKMKSYERINNPKIIRRVVPILHRGAQEEGKHRELLLLGAFDWMMEVAALMKISKNAYYRAILILKTAIEAEAKLAGSRINELACAALAMGCKL